MTFEEIVSEAMLRLNLSSDDARDRVGQRVNSIYRRVTSSIGLITSRRVTIEETVDPTDENDLPYVTIDGIEKILKITTTEDTGVRRLDEVTSDEITNLEPVTAMPRAFAISKMGPGLVTIVLDAFPTDEAFTLVVEGYDITDTLSDDAEPYLPTDFHDLLVEGVMADELRKMEKPQLAVMAERKYEERLSDLRMFIIKSAYLNLYPSKNRTDFWGRTTDMRWN